jgi:hypothetical protein
VGRVLRKMAGVLPTPFDPETSWMNGPQHQTGKMVVKSKRGFSVAMKSHAAFSARVLEAQ